MIYIQILQISPYKSEEYNVLNIKMIETPDIQEKKHLETRSILKGKVLSGIMYNKAREDIEWSGFALSLRNIINKLGRIQKFEIDERNNMIHYR